MEILIGTSEGEVTVYTNFTKTGDTLTLRNFDIEGPGVGALGFAKLRRLGRQLGKQEGVDRIVIKGGRRTTGANPGHLPRDIILRVNYEHD